MQSSNIPNVWRPRGTTPSNPTLDRFRRPTLTFEQALFLKRFQDLTDKRRLHAEILPEDDWRRRLIDKALFSTYRDCLDLDVSDEVRDILERGQRTVNGKGLTTA
jgi:hypothetical protein